ncbi:MAG: hydroxymethylglutaryl-CoA lyase [Acidimicrobiia bacterium]|nr:hydroxymethylglutaryl-CoA lyase [Acidimicrobiia bacterium]
MNRSEYPRSVAIREVGPRDGLQNEAPISVGERVRLIDALSLTGLRRIEAASFVAPSAIPAMAGAEEVMAGIKRKTGIAYSALVPNLRGAERGLAANSDELEVVISASETHNQRNVNRTIDESLAAVIEIVALAHGAGKKVDAIVSTTFGCAYEGDVEPSRVAAIAATLRETGVDGLSFGDTTGMASPRRVHEVLDAIEGAGIAANDVGLHFHNTRGAGLANVLAGLDRGVSQFDASVGGLGGCPYAPGATGNIVTEDLVHMLMDMGIETGVDLDALIGCALLAQELVGRELPGQVMRSGPRSKTVEGATT